MNDVQYNAPNTRARVAARRARRTGRSGAESGSAVRPGTRKLLGRVLVTGKLVSLLLLAGSLAALWALFTSPAYSVREIEVRGNRALDAEAVAQLSGMRGQPIWFASAADAAQGLLASAYVEQAAVELALPDKAIITLVERQPDMRWQLGGVQYLVDSTGKVLEAAREPAQPGTLVIQDARCDAGVCAGMQPNDQVDPDALELARRLALRLPEDLQFTPASVGWDIALGVYVRTGGGQTIVFGQTDNFERKIAVLGYLLGDKTAFTFLDLRPANPYYRNDGRPAATPQPAPPSQ
jgi:cell division protein FtsQ